MLDIKPYTFRRFARLEVIYMFHTNRDIGLRLSEYCSRMSTPPSVAYTREAT
jgi:hypothetical protein